MGIHVSREKIVIGVGIATIAAEMIGQPPLWISIPVLASGFFLVAWGFAPDMIHRLAGKLPPSWKVMARLESLDKIITAPDDRTASLNRLGDKMNEGLRTLNRPVKTEQEFKIWNSDQGNWMNSVYDEIEKNFSKPSAIAFQSVIGVMAAEMPPAFDNKHNNLKLHLAKRINNLKTFLENQNVSR